MSVPPRILYVDDDHANCEMMSYLLQDESGYDVFTAYDGKQARDLIDREYFDFYLLDYCLPDSTAIDLCIHIRERYPDVPITIYSALDRKVDRDHAIAAGADHYLVKPDEFDKVKPHVEAILGRPSRTPATDNTGPTPSAEGRPNATHPSRARRRASGIM